MKAEDKYKKGPIQLKPGRVSSNGTIFKYYKQPFIVVKVSSGHKNDRVTLDIRDAAGYRFLVWSDAFLPNKEEYVEFNVFW